VNRADQKKVLTDFQKDFVREFHNLKEHPEIIFQQMYNRLQWGQGSTQEVIKPEFEKRSRPDFGKPWLHCKTRYRESEALIRTFRR